MLKDLLILDDDYSKLLSELKQNNMDVVYENELLKTKLTNLEILDTKLYKDCHELVEIIQDLKLSNEIVIKEIEENFIKSQHPPLFMCQQSLDDFLKLIQECYTYSDLVIKKHFNIEGNHENDINDDYFIQEFQQKLETIRQRFIDEQFRYEQLQTNFHGRKEVIKSVREWNLKSLDCSDIQNQILNLNREIYEITTQRDLFLNAVQTWQKEMSILKMDKYVTVVNNIKIERSKKRLQIANNLVDSTNFLHFVSELLWMLIDMDRERLDRVQNYSMYEKVRTKNQDDCMKKIVSVFYIIELNNVLYTHG